MKIAREKEGCSTVYQKYKHERNRAVILILEKKENITSNGKSTFYDWKIQSSEMIVFMNMYGVKSKTQGKEKC